MFGIFCYNLIGWSVAPVLMIIDVLGNWLFCGIDFLVYSLPFILSLFLVLLWFGFLGGSVFAYAL